MILFKCIATWALAIIVTAFIIWLVEQITDEQNSVVEGLWVSWGWLITLGIIIFPLWGIVEIWR